MMNDEEDDSSSRLAAVRRQQRAKAQQQRRGVSTSGNAAPLVKPTSKTTSLGDDEEEDEVIVKIDKSRAALRLDAALAEPAVGVAREDYSAERLAQLKKESIKTDDGSPLPIVDTNANVVVSGAQALKLTGESQQQEASSSSSSSSSDSESAASSPPRSPSATLKTQIKRGPDTPESILAELDDFERQLLSRREELVASLSALSALPPPDLGPLETKAAEATSVRSGLSDMQLYLRGLRACLGALVPLLDQFERSKPPRALARLRQQDALLGRWLSGSRPPLFLPKQPENFRDFFASVHEDFASADKVVQRFAAWRQSDPQSYDASRARDGIADLVAPFVRFALCSESEDADFPPLARPSEWPGMPRVDDDLVASIAAKVAAKRGPLELRAWAGEQSRAALKELAALAGPELAREPVLQSLAEAVKGACFLPARVETDEAFARVAEAAEFVEAMAEHREWLGLREAGQLAGQVWAALEPHPAGRRQADMAARVLGLV